MGSATISKFRSAFGTAEAGANKASKAAGNYNQTMNKVGNTLNWFKRIALTVFAGALLSGIIETTAKAQGLSNAIIFASGSAEEGKKNMDFLASTSERLGLSLEASQTGFKTLAASMMGSSLQGQATRDIFEGVSIGASAMGLTADQAEGAFLALGQMMGKGKVQAEELRGQLGERIPGAFHIAARAMGVTTQALDKMMQNGEIMAEDFLPKFGAEMKKTFSGALGASVNSLQANLNRFNNTIYQSKVTLGTMLLPVINKVIGGVNELGKFIMANGQALKNVFAPLTNAIRPILNVFDQLAERFKTAANGGSALEMVFNGIGNILQFLEPALVAIGELIGIVIEKIVNIGLALKDNKFFQAWATAFVNTITYMAKAAKEILGGIGDIVTGMIQGDISMIKKGFGQLGTGLVQANPVRVATEAIIPGLKAGYSGRSEMNFFNNKKEEEKGGVPDSIKAAAGTGKPTGASTGSDHAKKGVEAIAGGGKQNININFEDVTLVGEMNFQGGVTENKEDIKRTCKELLAEILNGAIYTARQ